MKTMNEVETNQTCCRTCGRPLANPFRRVVDGVIMAGCVASDHDGEMVGISNTAAWHRRPAAKQIRRDWIKFCQVRVS